MKRLRRLIASSLVVAGVFSATAGVTTSGASSPKKGGVLTALITSVWPTLDPAGPTITPAEAVWQPDFEPLFWESDSGVLSPWLALSSKVSDGGLLITLQLRHGVKFQDGTPFDASAVVYNLDRYASPTVASECVTYLADMASANAVGKYEVQVHLTAPDSGFVPVLGAYQCGLMVSPTAAMSEGANFGLNPVGTGPFKYSGGTPGTLAQFTAYKGYWGSKPYLSGVTLEEVGSNQAAYDAVETGQANFWPVADGVDYQGVARQAGIVVQSKPAFQINYVTFSIADGAPFNNPIAREAVMYATDTTSIIKNLELGIAKPVEGVFPPTDFAYPTGGKIPGYPSYNLAKAKQLVAELGGSLNFTMVSSNVPTEIQLDEALQAEWAQAGINVTLDPLAGPALITLVHNLHFQALAIANPYLPDPDMVTYRWFYSKSTLSQNGLVDPVVDKWILDARASNRQSTRKVYYQEINKRLEDTDYIWDDLFTLPAWAFLTSNVHGLVYNPNSLVHWNDVWMS